MVFEVVQRRRVEALGLRFSASDQIIRSHVLWAVSKMLWCRVVRARSSTRWRIHQKGSMFWTRHSTLPGRIFPTTTSINTQNHTFFLRQPRSPQTFSHRAPWLDFKSWCEKSTHQDAPWGWKNPQMHMKKLSRGPRPGQNVVSRAAFFVGCVLLRCATGIWTTSAHRLRFRWMESWGWSWILEMR